MGSDTKKAKTAAARDAKRALEILFEISEAVNATRNLSELYKVIHNALARMFNVDNFYIALHHESEDSISFPYYVDEKDHNPDEIFNFSETASLTGQVIKTADPLIFYEKDIVDFARAQNKKTIGTLCKVWIGAPLIIKGRVIGAIVMQSFQSADDYQKKDLNLLSTISHHIALAIERKESNEKLSEQKKTLEKILELSPVGICLVENQVFKWVNNKMLDLFGYDRKADLEEKNVRIIHNSEADYKEVGKIIFKDLALKGKSDFDYNMKKKDGTLFKAHIITSGSENKNPLERAIVTIADISEQETAQKEQLEREKLQGVLEMARAVCHEINEPLQTILGYSNPHQEGAKISSKELENIKGQASRIGEMTKRLSNITHYKTIDHPGNTKIVDIWGSSNFDT